MANDIWGWPTGELGAALVRTLGPLFPNGAEQRRAHVRASSVAADLGKLPPTGGAAQGGAVTGGGLRSARRRVGFVGRIGSAGPAGEEKK
jgi:hypothetical protein